jgi:hypothetical protein
LVTSGVLLSSHRQAMAVQQQSTAMAQLQLHSTQPIATTFVASRSSRLRSHTTVPAAPSGSSSATSSSEMAISTNVSMSLLLARRRGRAPSQASDSAHSCIVSEII